MHFLCFARTPIAHSAAGAGWIRILSAYFLSNTARVSMWDVWGKKSYPRMRATV